MKLYLATNRGVVGATNVRALLRSGDRGASWALAPGSVGKPLHQPAPAWEALPPAVGRVNDIAGG